MDDRVVGLFDDVERAVEVELAEEVNTRRRELEEALLTVVAAEDAVGVPVEDLCRLLDAWYPPNDEEDEG
jgi:hypothetical protein